VNLNDFIYDVMHFMDAFEKVGRWLKTQILLLHFS